MQKLIIHSTERSDLSRLDAIIGAMGVAKDVGYFERQFEHQAKGTRQIFISTLDQEDVGYCILNWQPKYALFKKLAIPEIQDLNVLSSFRRRGIATQKIIHCENLAVEKGYAQMGIGVSVSPAFGPAQRLYVKLGYMPDGNGVTHDRGLTTPNEMRPLDDQLCLMMVKNL